MKGCNILIPCGGTGGHLFPGIAVAEKLMERGHKPLLVLSEKQVDREAIKNKNNLDWRSLPVVGWPGFFSKDIFSFSLKLFQGYKTCRCLFLNFKPDLVLAFGGFISALPLFLGLKKKIPLILHEANATAGLVTKLFSRFAQYVLLGMKECEIDISPGKKIFTGIPLRRELTIRKSREEACRSIGFDPLLKTIFIFGGSQGAQGINRLVVETLPYMVKRKDQLQFIHLTGPKDYDECLRIYNDLGYKALVESFSHRMAVYYSSADLVISRAGATTLTEICAYGLPSILIPYPYAANDHQMKNAQIFQKAKAAFLFEESKVSPELLLDTLSQILDDSQLAKKMGTIAQQMFKADSTDKIVEIVERCLSQRTKSF
ncbi:undecaprenyldiphospho-muramoylpentapeptide beta-N-acetylglucosaminyltransferase [Methylacidiphilum caldifontis]|uniref:undecaprenyldiphospho-muramoylpentapeptide beta-N-acetylglucosaminyltransferase n=1 Tax=Methylacidiphilum caldifontis TaxID=2795386 RepID=UPI001A902DE1|nr:undecaprenyldiphospho-muramoylpentapeptide beta-N-acetylglucosaminyltransferase [Methylacidiphilum caldifontis]QSR88728.1 undecaprenyldiphospho-muramoylpentapeptide beta-N-acetylglucosaminyltransferase [Methylacidiphilum caldifontis]